MADDKKTEKKKLNFLQLLAVSGASVASMCIGSIFGIRGTYIGTGTGTLISGVLAFFFEKMSLKAKDDLRRKAKFFKPEDEDATSMFPAIKVKRSQRPWMLAGLGAGMAVLSAGIALGIFGVIRGTTGTTLGDYTPPRPQPVRTVTETPTAIVTTPDAVIPAESFSASPSPSATTPGISSTPPATVTLTVSPRASISPSATVSPAGSP